MPLIDLKTDLKSLKYGQDRPGGGSSKQPFIVKDLNNIEIEDLGRTGGPDWLVRGGLQAPARSLQDASRIFQLFTQTPVGSFFTVKQNLLSRVGTDMDGGYPQLAFPLKALNGPLNQGIYSPLNTLAQVLVNAGGIHLFKQGINPFTGGPKYQTMIAPAGAEEVGIKNKNLNRLVHLYRDKISSNEGSKSTILFEYGGGPGSVLGIGKTVIPTATERTPFIGFGIDRSIRYSTFSQYDIKTNQLLQQPVVGPNGNTVVQDFRKFLDIKPNSIISESPNYKTKNIEQRVKLGDPGKRNVDRSNYTKGIVDEFDNPQPLDQINSLYLYKSTGVTQDKKGRKNDLVKFRIATIDNNNPKEKVFTHFRAFINSFTDSMNSTWDSFKYLGRGEDFYSYRGFSNSVQMSFTVVAQSIQELSIMYQKLNYLKSTLAPDYSDSGYMRGNLHQLTMGGYFYETPGIIDSLTYTIPNDTTWEIGIPASKIQSTEAAGSNGFTDSSVKELPHRIEVQLSFKPIFKFLPQKVKDINAAGNITQRFISLEDNAGTNTLYDNGVSNIYRPTDHQITGDPRNQTTPNITQEQEDQLNAAIAGDLILGSEGYGSN